LELLQNKADKDVLLTLNKEPKSEGSREVIVHPIGGEYEIRYIDWVKSRREYVEKASGGKIGYLHLSDMSTNGLCQFGQQYYPQSEKQAMILDVRHNGGGFIAPMLLSELSRKVWSTSMARRTSVSVNPNCAFYGHYAIICDNETGSDGETFTEGAKLLNLGKVFGTRTWGGWVGIRMDKPFNDNGAFATPEFTGWGVIGEDKGEWLIEGHGVDPDEEVIQDPGSVLQGKDPQLDATINHLLDKLAKEPPKLPDKPKIPKKDVNY
jgi:tricorn protease